MANLGSRGFRTVVLVDFEFEVGDGDPPNVLCMVAYVLDEKRQHIDTIRRWRGEFGAKPPFDIGPDTLVAGYSLWAEMTCFAVLGWRLPTYVYDLHTAFLAVSNILLPYAPDETRQKPRKRLSDACCAYGIDGWADIDKPEMAKAIGDGRWREYGQPAVLQYCEEDVRASSELLRRQLTGHGPYAPVDPQFVMRWSEYSAKTVAKIQARGMPIDMPLWELVQGNKQAIIRALLQRFDPTFGEVDAIYTPDGEFSTARFTRYLVRTGTSEWPQLASGALQLDSDAFDLMATTRPDIERIAALRKSVSVVARARIPIGRDGRNRPSLFPFGTATGRNAQAKSLFNVHASMRSFMRFPVGKIGLYCDWRTQEIGIAAARSGDPALAEDYSAGDIYYALAKMCGLTNDPDIKRWKRDNPTQRQRMKALQLGINYGIGVRALSRGLDRHLSIGSEVIIRHQRRYPTYWAWRENGVQRALLERVIVSEFDGWPLHIAYSPNERTLFNFPMQAGGAEMLRRAANQLCEAGLVPSMLVHDGILFELDNDEQVQHAVEIMRAAGAFVCRGLEIGVDIDQKLVGGARYVDKRPIAGELWAVVMGVLVELGALSKAG